MRALLCLAFVVGISGLCTSPAVLPNRYHGWINIDGVWTSQSESNIIEIVSSYQTLNGQDHILLEKSGPDSLSVECVKGCRCNGGDITANVTEIPIIVKQTTETKANKCYLRFVAHGPDVKIIGVGDECILLHEAKTITIN